MVASRHYGKGVFSLAMEVTMEEVVEKWGGKHFPLKSLEQLRTWVVLSPGPIPHTSLTGPSYAPSRPGESSLPGHHPPARVLGP